MLLIDFLKTHTKINNDFIDDFLVYIMQMINIIFQ